VGATARKSIPALVELLKPMPDGNFGDLSEQLSLQAMSPSASVAQGFQL
jgi:hypothetical protein